MGTDKQRILEKIQKCMALSDSSNAAEAAAALRQAQKLMTKHGVQVADLELHTVKEKKATGTTRTKVTPFWVALLRYTIGEVFGVQQLFQIHKHNGQWTNHVCFIGIGEKPAAASYCYDVLYRQLERDRRNYRAQLSQKLKRSTVTRRLNAFSEAWVAGVHQKVEAMAVPEEEKTLMRRYKETAYDSLSEVPLKASSAGASQAQQAAAREGYKAGQEAHLFRGVNTQTPNESLTAV